jgi:hypothetical protein
MQPNGTNSMQKPNAKRLYAYPLIFKTDPPFPAKVIILRVQSHLKSEDEALTSLAAGIGDWVRETGEGQALAKGLRFEAPTIADLVEHGVFDRKTLAPFLATRDVLVKEVIDVRGTHFFGWDKTMVDPETVQMMHMGWDTSPPSPRDENEISP